MMFEPGSNTARSVLICLLYPRLLRPAPLLQGAATNHFEDQT